MERLFDRDSSVPPTRESENGFYRRRADRRKEARVSFNNYERLNVSRAANTKDLIYNDGWFNWIEQLRSYKITTRNNCGVVVSNHRAGFTLKSAEGDDSRGFYIACKILTRGAQIKISFSRNGITAFHWMRFGSGCGEQTIIVIARNRIALNRISDLFEQRAIDTHDCRTEIKIPINE